MLLIKVFDDGVKEEVLKALQRSDFEVDCTIEGKDIKVKLGVSKKEHIEAAVKKIKGIGEEFKKDVKDARHNVENTKKKLEKIMP